MQTTRRRGGARSTLWRAALSGHRPLLWLLAAVLALQATVAAIPPLNGDEAFFWEWSRHLAPGYYSHPPLTAWTIAVTTALFGDSAFAVRLGSVLLHLGVVAIVYALGHELTRRRTFALRAAALYAVAPVSVVLGSLMTTDVTLIFCWAAATYCVKRAVVDGQPAWWYAGGVAAGGLLLSKFMAVFFFPATLLFLVLHPRYRHQLATRHPYLGFGVALVLFSPFLYWNATHDWLTFRFNLVARHHNEGFAWDKPLHYLAGQLLAASPVFLLLLVVATAVILWRFAPWRRVAGGMWEGARSLLPPRPGAPQAVAVRDTLWLLAILTALPLLVYLAQSWTIRIGAHWTAVVFPSAALVAAAWCHHDGRSPQPGALRRPWWYGLSVAGALAVSVPLVAVALQPRLLPDRLVYMERGERKLPPAAHYFGWREAGLRLAELDAQWSDGDTPFFFSAADYSLAAMLGFYTPTHPQFYLVGITAAGIHGREFLYWADGNKPLGATTIYVDDTPPDIERLQRYFARVQPLETLAVHDPDGRLLRMFHFTLARGYQGGEPQELAPW